MTISEVLEAICAVSFFSVVMWLYLLWALRPKPQKPRGKRIIMNPPREDLFDFLIDEKLCVCGTSLLNGHCKNPACEYNP